MVLAIASATAVVLLVLVSVSVAMEASRQAGSSEVRTTPLRRPTCLPAGPCIAPVPNLHRNERFGYSLVVPGYFRVVNESTASAMAPTVGLLNRERFTSRTAEEDAAAAARYGSLPPWDLIVEVYDLASTTAADRARIDGCVAPCVTTATTIKQEPTLAASWAAGALQVHAYYIERVDRLLVLKYATGPEKDRPAGVTEADFQRTVQLIGLVPVPRGS